MNISPDACTLPPHHPDGQVAELVDALASGASDRKVMRVRFSPCPPRKNDGLAVVFTCPVAVAKRRLYGATRPLSPSFTWRGQRESLRGYSIHLCEFHVARPRCYCDAMSLSVIIPALNEARTIEHAVRETVKVCSSLSDAEIIVVDDGSTDGTAEIVRQMRDVETPIRIIRHDRNKGKGAAVRTGVLAAEGEWIVYLDADLSVHPSEIKRLLAATDEADVIIGSRRVLNASITDPQPFARDYAGRLFNLIVRLMTGLSSHDTQCGFKAFHRKTKPLFEALETNGWAFDVELLVRAELAGLHVKEVPVTWRHGKESRVKWSDARKVLKDLRRIRTI